MDLGGNTLTADSVSAETYARVQNGTIVLPPDELPDPMDYVYKVITVELPADREEDYVLKVYRDAVIVEERIIPVGTLSTQFRVAGKDVMSFVFMIDNEIYRTMEVDFTFDTEPIDPNPPAQPEDPTQPSDPTQPTVPEGPGVPNEE